MAPRPGVVLHWIPLGAGTGGALVRASGRAYERLVARRDGRAPRPLFHSALEASAGELSFVVEVGPVWQRLGRRDRGVVVRGPVGARILGRSPAFRYEVRRWPGGGIPDLGAAIGGPVVLSEEASDAVRLWELLPTVPDLVWGRDESGVGEMWNSNSVIAWVLVRSGLDAAAALAPPGLGRAPGWAAGIRLARRA